MQRQPKQLDALLPVVYRKVSLLSRRPWRSFEDIGFRLQLSQLDGVVGVQTPHFWTLCSDKYEGAIRLEIRQNADYRFIMKTAKYLFTQIGVSNVFIQIDYTGASNGGYNWAPRVDAKNTLITI